MDSLDVNDTCKRPITNLKSHFCLWRNYTNTKNPQREVYSSLIKLPRNTNSEAKKISKKRFSL